MDIKFEIAGGKYEPDGAINYKYIDSTESSHVALAMYACIADYPFNYLRVILHDDGQRREITLLGDTTEEENKALCLRMDIASLWMTIKGEQFVDLASDPGEQFACIAKHVKGIQS